MKSHSTNYKFPLIEMEKKGQSLISMSLSSDHDSQHKPV